MGSPLTRSGSFGETCEVLALVLTLIFDAAFSLFVALALLGLIAVVALLPFGGIERVFVVEISRERILDRA